VRSVALRTFRRLDFLATAILNANDVVQKLGINDSGLEQSAGVVARQKTEKGRALSSPALISRRGQTTS
jgi:hypothetical protein